MQQKHRKRSHSRPIIPIHALMPKGGSNGNQHQHSNNGHQKLNSSTVDGKPSALGKRKREKPPQDHTPGAHVLHIDAAAAANGKTANNKRQRQQEQQSGHKQHWQPLQGQQSEQQDTSSQRQQLNTGGSSVSSKGRKHKAQAQQQPQAATQQDSANLAQPKQQNPAKSGSLQQQHQAHHPADSKHTAHPNKGAKAAAKQQLAKAEAPANQPAAADNGAPGDAAGTAPASATVPAADGLVTKPWRPKQPTAVGSNWQALQQQLKQEAATKPRRPRKRSASVADSSDQGSGKQIGSIGHNKAATPIIAMDCEMVGLGPGGERDSLARVSIVNASGNVLYDSFVAQKEPVTDYRTWVSGVTAEHLVGAPDISQVQKEVTELLSGRVLVGHGLKKDLSVLMLSHPRRSIRDTAKYPPFTFSKGGKRRPRALKLLAQQELGISIQEGQHSSVDDARAALYLYQKHAAVWEKALKTPQGLKQLPTANRPVRKKRIESYSVRDVKDDPMADL